MTLRWQTKNNKSLTVKLYRISLCKCVWGLAFLHARVCSVCVCIWERGKLLVSVRVRESLCVSAPVRASPELHAVVVLKHPGFKQWVHLSFYDAITASHSTGSWQFFFFWERCVLCSCALTPSNTTLLRYLKRPWRIPFVITKL